MSDDSGNKNLLIILLGVWVGYSMHYLFWPEAALETQHCYAMLPVAVGQICYVFVTCGCGTSLLCVCFPAAAVVAVWKLMLISLFFFLCSTCLLFRALLTSWTRFGRRSACWL